MEEKCIEKIHGSFSEGNLYEISEGNSRLVLDGNFGGISLLKIERFLKIILNNEWFMKEFLKDISKESMEEFSSQSEGLESQSREKFQEKSRKKFLKKSLQEILKK